MTLNAVSVGAVNATGPLSNNFFTQNGAVINRVNDRMFVGAATQCSGNFPQTTNDWLSSFYNSNGYTLGFTLNGNLVVLGNSSASGETVIAGSQTALATSGGAFGTGFYGVGIANSPTHNTGVNAYYGEAHNVASSASSAYGMELDVRTLF